MKISPSLMCMDLLKFKEQIEFIDSHADYFHIDIMDGHFVPNLTLSPFFVSQVKKLASKPLDCHLMVTRPQDYIAQLARAGADFITLHPETINGQAFRLIDFVFGSLDDSSARTYIIKIVEILCRILFQFIWVQDRKSVV